jgi:hypothetical protein
MPVLANAKHELFAQELAKGISADQSYETAGFKPNRHNAATLARKQHILDRVAEILVERESIHAQATADAVKSVGLTKQWVIETLMENVARAMQAKPAKVDDEGAAVGEYVYQGSVANRALELLGKEVGMFIDRKEVRTGSLDELPPDTLAELREQLNAERVGRADSGDRPETGSKPH